MSSVSGWSKSYTVHGQSVPLYDGHAVVKDVFDAIEFSRQTAEALDINTNKDDWLRVRPGDESIDFYFETEMKS